MKGFEYIWDYFRGKRGGKAANRLEREALSDPFLYEAMEGMEGVEGDHEQAVKELEARLGRRTARPGHVRLYPWLVAASFLLAGGVAVWLWTAPDAAEEAAVVAGYVAGDSAGSAVVVAAAVPAADAGQGPEGEAGGNPDRRQAAAVARKAIAPDEGVSAAADDGAAVPDVCKDTVRAEKENDTVSGKSVEDMLRGAMLNTDIVDAPPGSRSAVRIRGTRSPGQRAEEEVIPYSTGKRNARRAKSVASLGADWNHKAEGCLTWLQRFNRYVADSLRYPEVARAGQVEGEVRLSVRLNKRGHAVRIRVLRGVTPECDREAIRLVEAYGGVLGDERTGNKIELVVPFRLDAAR